MRAILPADKNAILRQKAREIRVSEIKSRHVQNLIKEMKALLAKEEYGVALAAPQVGEPLRLFIVSGRALSRGSRSAPDEPTSQSPKAQSPEARPRGILPDQVYINPALLKVSRAKKEKHEGCLSIRGKWGAVPRAEKATIRAYDERGARFMRGASGFLAHIFQHEMDHLEGILYTDKATHVHDEDKRKQ